MGRYQIYTASDSPHLKKRTDTVPIPLSLLEAVLAFEKADRQWADIRFTWKDLSVYEGRAVTHKVRESTRPSTQQPRPQPQRPASQPHTAQLVTDSLPALSLKKRTNSTPIPDLHTKRKKGELSH